MVENSGEAPSGTIELQADWYDEGGDYLDNSNAYLQSLGAGETWAARVYFLGTGAENVDDYEIEGEYDTESPNFEIEGLELLEDEMEVSDREAVIRGRVENNTGEEQSYVEAIGKVYDSDGIVLGDNWTNVSDLRDGDTWSFDTTWRGRDRITEATDHEILITDSSL